MLSVTPNFNQNTNNQTSFKGKFIVKDARLNPLSRKFNYNLNYKFFNKLVEHGIAVDGLRKTHTIKVKPEQDITVFTKLKEIGVKFQTIITQ